MNTYFYLLAAFLDYYKKCCKKCGNKENNIIKKCGKEKENV